MRDMLARKFERCCLFAGFSPIPQGKPPHMEFVSDDGALRVPAVMQTTPLGTRLYRRGSLERLLAARKETTRSAGCEGIARHEGGALHSQAAASALNEEAPGAATPRASDDQPRRGE